MKRIVKKVKMDTAKKVYQKPSIERIELDTEVTLVMMSGPPGNPPGMPQIPNMPEGYIQKIFKFGW
jgi:hypothetical protein